jgi:hypothetical protein
VAPGQHREQRAVVPPEEANYKGDVPDGSFIYYTVYPAGRNLASLYQVLLGGGARRSWRTARRLLA